MSNNTQTKVILNKNNLMLLAQDGDKNPTVTLDSSDNSISQEAKTIKLTAKDEITIQADTQITLVVGQNKIVISKNSIKITVGETSLNLTASAFESSATSTKINSQATSKIVAPAGITLEGVTVKIE